MLKKVGYTNNLIPIGNVNWYTGKPCWTDGNVAYGRVRTGGFLPNAQVPLPAGFWIDAYPLNYPDIFTLLKDDFTYDANSLIVSGFDQYAFFCYPYVVVDDNNSPSYYYQTGVMTNGTESYNCQWTNILYMNSNGEMLTVTYDFDYNLYQYIFKLHSYKRDNNNNNQFVETITDFTAFERTYTNVGFVDIFDLQHNGYQYYVGYSPMNKGIWACADVDGAYLTVEEDSSQGPPPSYDYLIYDSYNTPHYFNSYYIGTYNGTSGVVHRTMPQTISVGNNVVLRLSDLGLIFGSGQNARTYANDPLKLLPDYTLVSYATSATNVSGVHANGEFVLSQQEWRMEYDPAHPGDINYAIDIRYGKIWHDGNVFYDDSSAKICNCFSLERIQNGRWQV